MDDVRSTTRRAGRHGTVLLIEDDPDIAAMLRLHMECAGFALVHRSSGEEGLIAFNDRRPRAILLDLGLPGVDGIEVARTIRAESNAPILMLTARDSEIDTIVGLEVGADDYITKPFSPRELLARLHAVLRRSDDRPTVATPIVVASHAIDIGRRDVATPNGTVIRPTAKEFDLLWYLAENVGLALSRAQILERVWGFDHVGETRTVDVHIRQLRKKLPDLPIATVWGIGYRIDGS